ncbi:MAG: chromophore lyase, partial [Clostridium sp.]|nr:chromophore lyase [Clostridium sp.]
WKSNGEMSGTSGESKRLEGIEIKLENAPGYSIEYRTHVQDYGWQEWKRNGEMSGTSGESKRLEGIEIRIVKK